MKWILAVASAVLVLVGGFFVVSTHVSEENQTVATADYKEAEYLVEGEWLKIDNEVDYFGNELLTDLNGDGREDIVFLITHQPGGSGTFYYVVGALKTEDGYLGSDGYLLGDRIAPQTTEVSQNPRHRNVVVVNYVDREIGQPMTAQPSVGKSVYLKLDPASMRWGIVEPDFEGESR
jgi:hypothetical protein